MKRYSLPSTCANTIELSKCDNKARFYQSTYARKPLYLLLGSRGGNEHFVWGEHHSILRLPQQHGLFNYFRRAGEIWHPFVTNILHFAFRANINLKFRPSGNMKNSPIYSQTKLLNFLLIFPTLFAQKRVS